MRIGRHEIQSVINGWIRLDGGAMFGVVPKVMWEESADADELNRIRLATRSLIAIDRESGRVILVDTGCGTKWPAEKLARYGIDIAPSAVADALGAAGFTVADVTDVVVTHLHFDHNGGLTRWYDEPGGQTELCFSRARHWIHRAHWEHAHAPHLKDRASFLPEDWAGLSESGLLRFLDGDEPECAIPGMSWAVSHGHTPYQLHPCFLGESAESLLFAGDIVPTVAHLRATWVMAYDVEPQRTIEEKLRFNEQAVQTGAWLALPHDPRFGAVRVDGRPDRPIVAATLPASD